MKARPKTLSKYSGIFQPSSNRVYDHPVLSAATTEVDQFGEGSHFSVHRRLPCRCILPLFFTTPSESYESLTTGFNRMVWFGSSCRVWGCLRHRKAKLVRMGSWRVRQEQGREEHHGESDSNGFTRRC